MGRGEYLLSAWRLVSSALQCRQGTRAALGRALRQPHSSIGFQGLASENRRRRISQRRRRRLDDSLRKRRPPDPTELSNSIGGERSHFLISGSNRSNSSSRSKGLSPNGSSERSSRTQLLERVERLEHFERTHIEVLWPTTKTFVNT